MLHITRTYTQSFLRHPVGVFGGSRVLFRPPTHHLLQPGTMQKRSFSWWSGRMTLPKAFNRLTDATLNTKMITSASEMIDQWKSELEDWEGQVNYPVSAPIYFWLNQKNKSKIAYFRNELSKLLIYDDSLRSKKTIGIENELDADEKHLLLNQIDRLKKLVEQVEPSVNQKNLLGSLVRVCASLETRLGKNVESLSENEVQKLRCLLIQQRVKQAKHLKPSSLLQFDKEHLEKARQAEEAKRANFLDIVSPLHLGLDRETLHQFIDELTPQAQETLNPLLEKRENIVHDDYTWNRLIEQRFREKEDFDAALQEAEKIAEHDLQKLSQNPLFARLILNHHHLFLDDFYRHCYLLKYLPFLGYFHSAHISELFDEQHVNKQLKAAGEILEEDPSIPFCLMIRSSLGEKDYDLVPASSIPFSKIHISDQFMDLARRVNIRHLESSSRTERNQIFYLPGKGLCEYNPTHLPDSFENAPSYPRVVSDTMIPSHNGFSPAISYNSEYAGLKGTHAFYELFLDGKIYYVGKFSDLCFNYEEIKTYWSAFRSIAPFALGKFSMNILIPDQNIGYEDRNIAVLKKPLPSSSEQLKKVWEHIHSSSNHFKVLDNNCTALPEQVLAIHGIDIPSTAPLHALLQPTHPLLSKTVKWLRDHPRFANAFMGPLGNMLGEEEKNGFTIEKLDKIISPYVLRIYIQLKNFENELEELQLKKEESQQC
ncbi:MAG: hypothetical protein AAGG81_07515 [Chlamydiota bacterium]